MYETSRITHFKRGIIQYHFVSNYKSAHIVLVKNNDMDLVTSISSTLYLIIRPYTFQT